MSSPWPAPTAAAPVQAVVRLPGSKSMTNRALVLAALASGRSVIRQPLHSRDTSLMARAVSTLGATVDTHDPQRWAVTGGSWTTDAVAVDVGNAGTVLRFVPPVASLTGAPVSFDGDAAARSRPVAPLLGALRALGVAVADDGRGALPFTVQGTAGTRGGPVELDASGSSQLVSGLLLVGSRLPDGITVRHVGARSVPNAPHLEMSVRMLRDRGVAVAAGDRQWSVSPGPVAVVDQVIEPDLSTAAPFLAAAAVTGGAVRVPDWPGSTAQPGRLLPELLTRFGASCRIDSEGLLVTGGDRITGADLDLRDAGELTPVLAAVAALAATPSRLTGVDYLRGHETDRLAALARELNALGGHVTELDDGLEIIPKPLRGAVFSTYDDHRLAMAAAVLGLVVPGIRVENIETTAKTMPGFTAVWTATVAAQPEAAR